MVPTLLLVTILTFLLFEFLGGDPVSRMASGGDGSLQENQLSVVQIRQLEAQYHLNRPVFYFSIHSLGQRNWESVTKDENHLAFLEFLNHHYDEKASYQFYKEYMGMGRSIAESNIYIPEKERWKNIWRKMIYCRDVDELKEEMQGLTSHSRFRLDIRNLNDSFQQLNQNEISWQKWVPVFSWNGFDNRYHIWLKGVLKGDFGSSMSTGKDIQSALYYRLGWTLVFGALSLVISFGIAFLLARWSSLSQKKATSQLISIILLVFYSFPVFWIASMLIVFVAGEWNLLPSYGLYDAYGEFQWSGMILPLFCWTYASIAYLYSQIKGNWEVEMNKDYVRTAFSKGLTLKSVLHGHTLKNALMPIVTIFGSMLPVLISGSVVIEVLFSIPGIGKYLYDAILLRDYPVVMSVVVITSWVTIIGYFLTDVLYTWLNPKIKLNS